MVCFPPNKPPFFEKKRGPPPPPPPPLNFNIYFFQTIKMFTLHHDIDERNQHVQSDVSFKCAIFSISWVPMSVIELLKAGSSIIKLVHDGYDLIITKKVDNMPIIHRLAHYNSWVVLFRTVKRSKYYRYGVKYQLIKALIELIKSINQSMKQSIKEASKQCVYHYVSRISFIYLRPSPDLWWSAMIARDVVSFFFKC